VNSNLVLHIGLHKTATTFLQERVFRPCSRHGETFVYNPFWISRRLSRIYNKVSKDLPISADEMRAVRTEIGKATSAAASRGQIVLISNESISQSLAFQNWRQHFQLFTQMFPPSPTVILGFRYQMDWLESCYRHLVSGGIMLDIDEFFNLNGDIPAAGYKFDLRETNFTELYKTYASYCNKDRVHVLFYEDMKDNRQRFEATLERATGQSFVGKVDYTPLVGRSHSAKATNEIVKLGKRMRVPYKRKWLTVRRPFRIALLSRLWAGVEKFWYSDWDLMNGNPLKRRLQEHFRAQNHELAALLGDGSMPKRYLE
jgi:hypothetical protein